MTEIQKSIAAALARARQLQAEADALRQRQARNAATLATMALTDATHEGCGR